MALPQFQDLGSSQTLKNKVYEQLRQLIITGELPPGSRLPEEDLSKQMNISRAPIREALNMLEREGFATITPRRGAIVSELTAKNVADIWEMRLLLEPYAARVSLHLIPQKEIDEIHDMVIQTQQNPTDLELYMACDIRLHELLHKYKDNSLLEEFLATTNSHSMRARFIAEHDRERNAETMLEVSTEHLRITKAMKAHDAIALEEAVQAHISKSLTRSSAHFAEQGSKEEKKKSRK